MNELDSDAAQVEEHEHTSIAHIEMKIGLNDFKVPIETLAHFDGFSVQANLD